MSKPAPFGGGESCVKTFKDPKTTDMNREDTGSGLLGVYQRIQKVLIKQSLLSSFLQVYNYIKLGNSFCKKSQLNQNEDIHVFSFHNTHDKRWIVFFFSIYPHWVPFRREANSTDRRPSVKFYVCPYVSMTNIIITSLYGAPVHQEKKQTINCNECILRCGSSFITNLFPPLSLGTSTVTLHTWIRIARSFISHLKCLLILFAAPLADTHISGSVASRRRLI